VKSAVGFDRGFTGYVADGETGLLHARTRPYSPTLGRFVGRDVYRYIDGYSMYQAYFLPNGVDPTGMCTDECTPVGCRKDWELKPWPGSGPATGAGVAVNNNLAGTSGGVPTVQQQSAAAQSSASVAGAAGIPGPGLAGSAANAAGNAVGAVSSVSGSSSDGAPNPNGLTAAAASFAANQGYKVWIVYRDKPCFISTTACTDEVCPVKFPYKIDEFTEWIPLEDANGGAGYQITQVQAALQALVAQSKGTPCE